MSARTATRWRSGYCGTGHHRDCCGTWAWSSTPCACDCHTPPPPPPSPAPRVCGECGRPLEEVARA